MEEIPTYLLDDINNSLRQFAGKTSFYFENLITGASSSYQSELPMMAASIIKIPIMIALFDQAEKGKLHLLERYVLKEEDKKPSCGALNVLHNGLELTLEDLCSLMIILSDNSATNILIKRIGMDTINAIMQDMNYTQIRLNRFLFDREASERGIQNYVSVKDIADMLKKMYLGTLVSQESSKKMLEILKNQRLNGKIPFHFTEKIDIAHKTGEDTGITHDVGILFGKEPLLLLFMGNEVDVPVYERFMQDTAYALYCNSGNNIG